MRNQSLRTLSGLSIGVLTLPILITPAHAQSINLVGIVRDFLYSGTPSGIYNGNTGVGHPDFENAIADSKNAVVTTLTDPSGGTADLLNNSTARFNTKIQLDTSGGIPVTFSSSANFNQWYNDAPGVNVLAGYYGFTATNSGSGVFTYVNNDFFPMNDTTPNNGDTFYSRNGGGFGAQGNNVNNYGFTFEVRTNFQYLASANQSFTYTGDDDVWVFINGRLAIDLGGVHAPQSQTIDLNTLASQSGNPFNIINGQQARLDIFTAERHTTGSNLRIDTNIPLTTVAPPGFTVVPETGTLAMGMLGLLLTGAVSIVRRKLK